MRKLGITFLFVTSLLAANLAGQQAEPAKTAGEEVRVIAVTAKKYEFNPGEIRVKKGSKVQLKIHALDRTHGFKIRLYPEGEKEKGAPGLIFTSPQQSWKLEKDQERVIEFVAERAGTYPFRCADFCGMGHFGMKGKLVVE